jgi:hypothetical protein
MRGKQLFTLKDQFLTKCHAGNQNWRHPLKWPSQQKMDMRLETWNGGSLCRAGSLQAVASDLVK